MTGVLSFILHGALRPQKPYGLLGMREEWDIKIPGPSPCSHSSRALSVLFRREEKYISPIRIQLEQLWQRLLAFKWQRIHSSATDAFQLIQLTLFKWTSCQASSDLYWCPAWRVEIHSWRRERGSSQHQCQNQSGLHSLNWYAAMLQSSHARHPLSGVKTKEKLPFLSMWGCLHATDWQREAIVKYRVLGMSVSYDHVMDVRRALHELSHSSGPRMEWLCLPTPSRKCLWQVQQTTLMSLNALSSMAGTSHRQRGIRLPELYLRVLLYFFRAFCVCLFLHFMVYSVETTVTASLAAEISVCAVIVYNHRLGRRTWRYNRSIKPAPVVLFSHQIYNLLRVGLCACTEPVFWRPSWISYQTADFVPSSKLTPAQSSLRVGGRCYKLCPWLRCR